MLYTQSFTPYVTINLENPPTNSRRENTCDMLTIYKRRKRKNEWVNEGEGIESAPIEKERGEKEKQ